MRYPPILIIMALLVSVAALAFNPDEALRQYQQTDQQQRQSELTDRYEFIGQDGGIVHDTLTDLHWMRCSLGQTWEAGEQTCSGTAGRFKYADAELLARLLNEEGGYGDHTDWRLPTRAELQTLVYCSSGQPARFKSHNRNACEGNFRRPTLVTAAFPNTPAHTYWAVSLQQGQGYDHGAWLVHFNLGHVSKGGAFYYSRVRLVRREL